MCRIFKLIWTYFTVNLFELNFVDSALDLFVFVYGIKIQFNIRGV